MTSPRPAPTRCWQGDLGCLMNMAGKLQREGRAVKARHVAEVLADMGNDAAIGENR